jgi:hypothetical protein
MALPRISNGFVVYNDVTSVPNVESTEIIDSLVSGIPIAVQVLNAFGIPINYSVQLGSSAELPGYDIYNQDCMSVMQLSMATEFVNGYITECYINEVGQAYFVRVGTTQSSVTDDQVRFVIPLTRRKTPTDVVIVRGLKPPVRRELRTAIDGLPGKDIVDWSECKLIAGDIECKDKNYSNVATIIYEDLILNSDYNDDINSAFEKQKYEQLLGFLVDVTFPQEDYYATNEYLNLNVSFSKEEIRFPVSLDVSSLPGAELTDALDGLYILENCKAPRVTSEVLYGAEYLIGGDEEFMVKSIYEAESNKVSDLVGVEGVYVVGQKILYYRDYSAFFPLYMNISGIAVVEEKKCVYELEYGKNWSWGGAVEKGKANIYVFFDDREELRTGYANTGVEVVIGSFGGPIIRQGDFSTLQVTNGYERFNGILLPGVGDCMGYAISAICALVNRKRPSITITTTDGQANIVAESLSVTYKPIVIVDEPPPVGYASTYGAGILDQSTALGDFDLDPTTVQTFESLESDLDIIIDRCNGSIIDITLPFAAASDCATIAAAIYDFSNESEVDSYSYVLGPDATPKLGDSFKGAIINEIQYNYTDSSSYNINVTTGPAFLGMNSWSDSRYILRSEEISRNGRVIKDKGDGTTYVVQLEGGMGEIVALSTITDRIETGDTVSVTVYNNPQEKA